MGQLGFFDLSRRYEGLDAKGDPVVAILLAAPFEAFRPGPEGGAHQGRSAAGEGCPQEQCRTQTLG